MRKFTSLVLCILMIAMLAVPAMAEESVPTFVLTADKAKVRSGEIVTITVSVPEDNQAECCNFGVIVKYDKTQFELVKDGVDNYWDESDNNKVAGMLQGLIADPLSVNDKGDPTIFAQTDFPGVGAWNAKAVSGTDPNQTPARPHGKVGYVKLKCITAEGVEVTANITGIASVDGGTKSGTVTGASIEIVEGMLGDANGDGRVNPLDATMVLQYFVKLIKDNQLNVSVCDVNGDGRVNPLDATIILQYFVKLITEFPVEK